MESLVKDRSEEVPDEFIAVTETWLKTDHTDAQVNISGSNLSRSDGLIEVRSTAVLV